MSSLAQLKNEFIQSQARSWDDAVDRIRCVISRHDEQTGLLIRKLLEARDSVLTSLFLGPSEGPKGFYFDCYGYLYDPISILTMIGSFVSHELHDDGDPAIVYYRNEGQFPKILDLETKAFEMEHIEAGFCDKGDKLASPYLFRSGGWLEANGHPFVRATVASVIELLDEEEAKWQARKEAYDKMRTYHGLQPISDSSKSLSFLIPEFFPET